MINENKILGLLGLTAKAGGLVSGTDICIETIEKRKAKLIILAIDVGENTDKKIRNVCEKYNTPIISFSTIEKISKAIGKENRAVICIKNKNL